MNLPIDNIVHLLLCPFDRPEIMARRLLNQANTLTLVQIPYMRVDPSQPKNRRTVAGV